VTTEDDMDRFPGQANLWPLSEYNCEEKGQKELTAGSPASRSMRSPSRSNQDSVDNEQSSQWGLSFLVRELKYHDS